MSKAEIKVVEVALKDIQPYWRNPRKNKETIPALMKSIQRFGFNVPLVLDKSNVIVAGHARYQALQKLGWDTVPCVYTDMSQKKLREFRVMDNRVQEFSDWDEDTLNEEMERLFSGTDLAEYFDGTLDRVLDLSDYTDIESDLLVMDSEDVKKKKKDVKKVPGKKYIPRCPFCESEISKSNII